MGLLCIAKAKCDGVAGVGTSWQARNREEIVKIQVESGKRENNTNSLVWSDLECWNESITYVEGKKERKTVKWNGKKQ